MNRSDSEQVRVQIFRDESSAVTAALRLVGDAAMPRPLPMVLEDFCQSAATLLASPIVSVYLREEEEEADILVMRANFGFPRAAIGHVRLHLGEGITGAAAEYLKPLAVGQAESVPQFKPVTGLGEERYPIFLAIPIMRGSRPVGVLVFQRGARTYTVEEVTLATALTATVLLALEHSESRQDKSLDQGQAARRSARLEGTALVEGQALGVAQTLPTFTELMRERETDQHFPVNAVLMALQGVREELDGHLRALPDDVRRRISAQGLGLSAALHDSRFEEQVATECGRQTTIRALREVARSYALTPYRLEQTSDQSGQRLADRATEIEYLCLLLGARVLGQKVPTPGSVLMLPERLSCIVALAAASARCAAVVVANHVRNSDAGIAILGARKIPLLSEVAGLFAWSRPGDRIFVDADQGRIRINPSVGELTRLRRTLGKSAKG